VILIRRHRHGSLENTRVPIRDASASVNTPLTSSQSTSGTAGTSTNGTQQQQQQQCWNIFNRGKLFPRRTLHAALALPQPHRYHHPLQKTAAPTAANKAPELSIQDRGRLRALSATLELLSLPAAPRHPPRENSSLHPM
jgi:hypothetical protein